MTKTNLAIVFAVSTILGTTALAFNLVGSRPRSQISAVVSDHPTMPSASAEQNAEVEVITATPTGFEPASITRSRGPFILAVHNASGEKALALRIYQTQGQQLYEVRLRAGRRANHHSLDLPPGAYVISEAGHPDWSCALTITR